MSVLYLKRVNKRIHFFNEQYENRYKGFFCLYPSSKAYNRLYNFSYMIARCLIVVAVIVESSMFLKISMIAIGCLFFINEIA